MAISQFGNYIEDQVQNKKRRLIDVLEHPVVMETDESLELALTMAFGNLMGKK